MRAVTFQAPGEVLVQEVPAPELLHDADAIVQVEASGVCGSDLHIYHGRVKIEPGFTIGHEYVGTVAAAGPDVREVKVGDRVLGCFQTACGRCFFCRRGWFHKCDESRTFGHGATLGSLQGTQAERALVPNADLVLRKVPAGMSDDVALFAGDVMGTGYHAVLESGLRPGEVAAVLGLRALQRAQRGPVPEGARFVALVKPPAPAEEAASAGRLKASQHAVAHLHRSDVRAGGGDGANVLVADREAGLDLHPAVVDVQVGAAYASGLDLDDRVGVVQELGRGDLLHEHLAGGLEGDCAHRRPTLEDGAAR